MTQRYCASGFLARTRPRCETGPRPWTVPCRAARPSFIRKSQAAHAGAHAQPKKLKDRSTGSVVTFNVSDQGERALLYERLYCSDPLVGQEVAYPEETAVRFIDGENLH
jgi:hypothetical protein